MKLVGLFILVAFVVILTQSKAVEKDKLSNLKSILLGHHNSDSCCPDGCINNCGSGKCSYWCTLNDNCCQQDVGIKSNLCCPESCIGNCGSGNCGYWCKKNDNCC